jgi:YHS domain-containing protein
MKTLKNTLAALVAVSLLGGFLAGCAGDPATPAVQAQVKPYTLTNCVVSGDKLGEMGDPYVFVYEGREIKFCCKGCVKDFKKDPAKYVKKIEEAEAKAKNKS